MRESIDTPIQHVTAAVRCFALPRPVRRALRRIFPRGWRSLAVGTRVLVFDMETTTDAYQNLLIGSFRIYAYVSGQYTLVRQGLIVGDVASPAEIRVVEAHGKNHHLDVYSRERFVRQIFLPEVYDLGTLCVGFNLPFDLSRLAIRWAPGRKRWRDGFALYLTDSKWDPGIHVKNLDNKRAFIEFASYRGYQRREASRHAIFPGRFLDLRTLAFALTGEGYSLEKACRAFGVKHGKQKTEMHGKLTSAYIAYNRRDVEATWELYLKLVKEWNRHPFALVPTPFEVEHSPGAFLITRAYSPASLGKAYKRAMGILSRLQHQPGFSKILVGWSMAAYFGGRSECHIRRQIAPVIYLDVLSMYPTVCALMGLWRCIIADRIDVEEAPGEVQDLIERIVPDDLYKPETWTQFFVLAEVEPDDDIVPLRAAYLEGADYQIGLPVTTAEKGTRLYYMLPDLLASKFLTGKTPRIRRAWRFRTLGTQPGLRTIKVLGEVEFDPLRQDFFRVLIEKRHEFQEAMRRAETAGDVAHSEYFDSLQHGLKIVANALYGIFAEIDEKITGARKATVYGCSQFTTKIVREEHPGPYAFPPLAAVITSGARLMLAMLETELQRRGVTYAFCDTDSIAIDGSAEAVQAIRQRFAALTPYAFGGDLLKLEPENIPDPRATRDRQVYCYSISAKRYALYNIGDNGSIVIRKISEHGLGHLRSPVSEDDERWMRQVWAAIIKWARGEVKGLGDDLSFADLPALGKFPIMKPAVVKRFIHLNTKVDPKTKKRVPLPHTRQVKPFNFILVAFPATGDITTGGEAYWEEPRDSSSVLRHQAGQPIRPIAPYESDSKKWRSLQWVDLHTGKPVRLIWGGEASGLAMDLIRVQTYRNVLARYVTHPEAKAAGPDGLPCGSSTTGELSRLRVHVDRVVHIGKESNELEEVQAGLVAPQSAYVHYVDERVEWERICAILRKVPLGSLCRESGLSPATIKRARNGRLLPHAGHRHILAEVANGWSKNSAAQQPRELDE